jgi:hypothetical protein
MGSADHEDGANRRHREKRDPTINRDPEPHEEPLSNYRADQAKKYVGDHAEAAAMHQLTGQPSSSESNQQYPYHRRSTLVASDRYFFCSNGAPQHFSMPVPPLVTIT